MSSWVIDRIEEGFAVLEHTEYMKNMTCPIDGLPRGIREGDVLGQDGPFFWIDVEESAARSRRIKEKFNRIKKKTK